MTIVAALVVIALVAALGWYVASRYRRNSGTWVVECPQTESTAEVSFDGATRIGEANHRIVRCSHWPEHGDCNQGCVR